MPNLKTAITEFINCLNKYHFQGFMGDLYAVNS